MESGGHKSGSGAVPGAGAEGGLLCHACGYQYPNAHPSAKQRRAHRKHCGKPATAAAEEGGAGETEGRVLFPGEGGGATGLGAGDEVGASAAECGGGLPGSAQEAGSAAVDVDKSEHSSHDVAGAQVRVDKFVEDHSDVASGIIPETNKTDGGTLNEVAMEYSGKASVASSEQLQDVSVPVGSPEPGYGEGVSPELSVSEMQSSNIVSVASDAIGGEVSEQTNDVITESDVTAVTRVDGTTDSIDKDIPIEEKSVPASAVSSEHLQDVSVPVLPPEPGYDEGVSPELPVSEMHDSNVVSIASDATGGEVSEQTNDVITEPNDTTVTGVDVTVNTIDKDIPIKEKYVKGDDLDSSCQENLQTKYGEGLSNTAVKEDSSDKNLSAAQIEEIPNDKSDLNQQSSLMLTSSTEVVPNSEDEEPVKSGTQAPVGTDDFHSEVTDTVKPQEQPDCTSVAEDHLAVPEQTDIFEGDHYPNKNGGIEMISSAIGPVVDAEVISVGDADNMTKNVSSSDVTMGVTIQENVTSNTAVPSQADLVDLSTSSTAHEINMVNSTNDVEEKGLNEKSVADLTAHEINEVRITELVEEKQQDKEIIADSISHDAFYSTDNYGENAKETIAEASSCNMPRTHSIEEEKQIEEVIANLPPEKTIVTTKRDFVEENKQIEVDAMINREISVVCTSESIEEKDTTIGINGEGITDNVEDKKQSKEISASNISDSTSMIYTSVNDEKMHNEDMTEDPSSHEKIVVHNTDNVEERKYEESMVDPTCHSIGMVTTTDSVEERKNDETSADLTSHGINAPHSTDNDEEKKDGESILEPTSSNMGTIGGVGNVEEKQNEETTADQMSGENSTPQSTYDAEKDIQNKDATAVLVSDKSEVAKKTDDVEGTEQNKESTAKEISTVQSADDVKGAGQNEEIADKEVIVDSDRSHVSLKVLLADKNVETKEKKPSTKDRVLSFRRRSSKDNESPAKPGSPKADSGQQDWNSPARLPAEKKSKGKKQQWVPFICCPSIH